MNGFFTVSGGIEEAFRSIGEEGEGIAGTRFREVEILAEVAIGQIKIVIVAGKIRFRFQARSVGSEMEFVQLDGVFFP